MNTEALAKLFYQELIKLDRAEHLSSEEKINAVFRLLNLLFVEMTRREKLHFTTLFARIAYVCHQQEMGRKLEYHIHVLRKQVSALHSNTSSLEPEQLYRFAFSVFCQTVEALLKEPVPETLATRVTSEWPWLQRPANIVSFLPKLRVVALEIDEETDQFIARSEAVEAEVIRIQFNQTGRNENFNPTIKAIRHVLDFPLILNLIDVEIDTEGIYRPRAFVVEPDYLMDVSAVSEMFKDFGTEPILYLLKKFLPFETTKYLLIGNVANFFLDELMNDVDLSFKELFPKVFQLNPLALCLFEDRELREVMQKSQKHYINLKRMALQEFEQQGIDKANSYLEPTFYSETYGLQGRLDVFHKAEEGKGKSAIVELKSGKAYKPNAYGISSNHFVQTLLYDLIVRSVFGKAIDPTNYILYSGLDERQLRFAPLVKSQQFEAIQVRNQLVILERMLGQIGQDTERSLLEQGQAVFARLRTAAFPQIKGFVQRDIGHFEKVYSQMTPLERRYFVAFTGFIAREHLLAKTGMQGVERANGLAALWLNDFQEKQENFEILSHLSLDHYKVEAEQPKLTFSRTERTHPLANFRKGDIAVLYPFQTEQATVLSNQIFKCTIIDINPKQVVVVLRSQQFNTNLFTPDSQWNLEHDLMDGSFNSMYRGLFEFAGRSSQRKQLLLGQKAPEQIEAAPLALSDELTEEQRGILQKLISAKGYFLLWGPPGTGKTSMVLKHTVKYLIENTEENLLLLAYTNRAVDEICASIERIAPDFTSKYLRIGSRYATAKRFQPQLLNHKTAHCKTRKELRAVIDGHRIVVATVASLSSKPELLRLKRFDRLIIDEASQILEPMLVGLLSRFERFVLIGDHKQLPAVVVQDMQQSEVHDASLRALGLNNLRNSLFERLYLRCLENNWHWAYAQLSHQGRMHQDIMDFPNREFYGSSLNILPDNIPVHSRQVQDLDYTQIPDDALAQQLCSKRLIYFPTPIDETSATRKTNIHEAEQIKTILQQIKSIYQLNDRSLHKDSVGIITPYRAQIAQLREVLEAEPELEELLTIDTVERYQGGARDIIIISLCTNTLSQLDSLVSLSEDGVDRKLNVAITRAKEQLIFLGNPDILKYNPVYQKLMDYSLGARKT
jgi:DNA replication ATP-dependent helicase Dna2